MAAGTAPPGPPAPRRPGQVETCYTAPDDATGGVGFAIRYPLRHVKEEVVDWPMISMDAAALPQTVRGWVT